jgi:hypothetical protein
MPSSVWIFLSVALALMPTTAQAQVSPLAVLQHFYESTGGNNWQRFDECESTGTVSYSHKAGTIRYLEDLRHGGNRAEVEIPDLGVKQTDGNDPIQDWHQDAGGDIQLSSPSDPANVDDRYLTRRGYWQPGFGGATVTALAPQTEGSVTRDGLQFKVPGGKGFTLWINRKTGLLDRLDGSDTKQFSDYRRVSGVLLPFVERKPAGNSELIVTFTSRTLHEHISSTDFAIPFRTDYRMPPSGEVTVPAQKGLVFEASINGRGPFKALFDTGSFNIISEALAHRLGIKVDSEGVSFGTSSPENIQLHRAQVDTLQIGDLVLHDQTFHVISLPDDDENAPTVVVGYELMRRFGIKVDYDHERVTFYDGARFHYSGAGKAVPIQFDGNYLLAETTIGNASGPFILDTGNESGTFADTGFTNKNNLVQALGAHFLGYNGRGYAGPSPEAYLVRVNNLRIGDVGAPGTIVHLTADPSDKRGEAGNIGQDILTKFTEVFDCMHSQVIFETSKNSSQPEVFSRAGLIFDSSGHGLEIMTVLPGSPGAKAGLKVGDIVAEIDGRTTPDEVNPPAFFQSPGTTLHLTIRRGATMLTVTVLLRDVL